jgi:hypothetical protein
LRTIDKYHTKEVGCLIAQVTSCRDVEVKFQGLSCNSSANLASPLKLPNLTCYCKPDFSITSPSARKRLPLSSRSSEPNITIYEYVTNHTEDALDSTPPVPSSVYPSSNFFNRSEPSGLAGLPKPAAVTRLSCHSCSLCLSVVSPHYTTPWEPLTCVWRYQVSTMRG